MKNRVGKREAKLVVLGLLIVVVVGYGTLVRAANYIEPVVIDGTSRNFDNDSICGFTPGQQSSSELTYGYKGSGSITLYNDGIVYLTNSVVEGFVEGTGSVFVNGNVTIQANLNGSGKEDYNDNGGLYSEGVLTINVTNGSVLKSNIGANGGNAKVSVNVGDATIQGTEFAEILCAQNGGLLQINDEGAEQRLKIISEDNNNVGLNAYINANLTVYGLESLSVTRTKANRGVNGVYASSGSNVVMILFFKAGREKLCLEKRRQRKL